MLKLNERTKIENKRAEYATTVPLSPDLIASGEVLVSKIVETSRFTVSMLTMFPGAEIKNHGHVQGEEEYYFKIGKRRLTHCGIGKRHRLINRSDKIEVVISVKYKNCSQDNNEDSAIFYVKPNTVESDKRYGVVKCINLYKDANTQIEMFIINPGAALVRSMAEGEDMCREYIWQLPERIPEFCTDVTETIRNKERQSKFIISAKFY